ncbi:MAG TPA: protein kinase [Vicinamibacteria bacterium]|nr:protein kinase [Vicinamibacteria bacterium]
MTCPSCQAENRRGAWGCRRCKKALPTLVAGDLVGQRFEILDLLGTGGMGVVFRARDRTLEEIVALKTLRADLDAAEDLSVRFRTEIRLARMVSSRHVCRIHEYGKDDTLHYVSMEYVDGVTVKELLQETGGLPADVALDIAAQVLVGLTAIHDAGIMHRDVKPSNLMRTREGLVKLMDFGIAKMVGGVTLTAAGQAVGTPEYMSPEQVTGRDLDLRTDVYTVGIVVYELLTGASPFRADTPIATAHRQVTEMPDLQAPGIPAALEPLLDRALAKDREARFPSARELGVALAEVRAEIEADLPRSAAATAASRSGAARAATPGRRLPTAQSQAMTSPQITGVIATLRGGDAVAKRRAVLALADAGARSPEGVRALADALGDSDRRVRFMAAAALGRIGPAAAPAIPALLLALDDEAAGNEAAESLVRIGRAAVPALLAAMKSGQDAVRSHAATTLARIGADQGKARPPV